MRGRIEKGRIDDSAKGLFLEALKRGLAVPDAARAAGFSAGGFWKARKADAAFDEAVEEALDFSNVPVLVRPTNGRRLQRRGVLRARAFAIGYDPPQRTRFGGKTA